ncbi:MAG: GDSL family lipase [Robiginitomaculum sp.]|nr:MAG: GDSL family lipase [Robiginitomaculum sp.]
MNFITRLGLALLCLLAAILGGVFAHSVSTHKGADVPSITKTTHWLGSWASSQQIPEPRNTLPEGMLTDATLRQIVRISFGGTRLRVRISNQYGTGTLRVEDVQIAGSADPNTSSIDTATSQQLTFSGELAVNIPAGAIYTTDPVTFAVKSLDHLAISMYLPKEPQGQTSHPGSRATSYVVKGRQSGAGAFVDPHTVNHWYQLSGLEIEAPSLSAAIIIVGDSITDGYGTKPNTDTRWPDFFMSRIQSDPVLKDRYSVLNHGIGGNSMLRNGLGPNVMARYDENVLDQKGGKYLVLLEGVNDFGRLSRNDETQPSDYDQLVRDLKIAYAQIAATSREHGIIPVGGTIMPFGGSTYYKPNDDTERARQDLNDWIRNSKTFDNVIDFDAIMRASDNPRILNPAYDSGDHLHPSIIGYEAMADHIPLDIFEGAPR